MRDRVRVRVKVRSVIGSEGESHLLGVRVRVGFWELLRVRVSHWE